VALDSEWNVKLVDLDTLVAHPNEARLGGGGQCASDDACIRIETQRYTSYADALPAHAKVKLQHDGHVAITHKAERGGSHGTARHRRCLPKVLTCRCDTSVARCIGVDGVPMLADSIDNMMRPMLDAQHYAPPSDTFIDQVEQLLTSITPSLDCTQRALFTPARAVVALETFARQQDAFAVLDSRRGARRARHAALVRQFVTKNTKSCGNKDGHKCTG
jgi:hypothetical protein